MPNPACVKCQISLGKEKSGVNFVETFQENKQPYKLWSADLWKCPKCGIEIIDGFGNQPLGEHFQEKFNIILNKRTAIDPTIYFGHER